MKTTHRNSLLAALLACLAPAAASAGEAHLSPNTNGGSGAMPSGYSKLHFDLADGDWTRELMMPRNPRQNDRVVLTSGATYSSSLDLGGTTFADLLSLPITTGANIEFRWDGKLQKWYVQGGESARQVVLFKKLESTVPMSELMVTEVFTSTTWTTTHLNLPEWAPQSALLSFSNMQQHDVEVRSGSKRTNCPATQTCAYVFSDLDGAWHRRTGRLQFQPTEIDLPVPTARLMDVVVGSAAEDMTTPAVLRLPADAVDGDLYRLSNPSGDHFTRLLTFHSDIACHDMGCDMKLPEEGVTFRYDAATRTWRR
ncbi:TPA: hypothetical protein ACKP4S_000708 [Stenotrophomonas maltophilia]